MNALVRAELVKLRSTRMIRWLAASTLGVVALNVAMNILVAGRGDAAPLTSTEGVDTVFASAGSGMTLMLVVGIMTVAGEFRHGTATSTFLVTPRRDRVIAAKAAAAAVAGAAFAAMAVAVTVAMALPWLAVEDAAVSSFGGPAVVLAGCMFLTVAAGVLGVGVGALIRNQTVAVAVALSWVLIIEALIAGLVPAVGRWLLSGTAASIATSAGTGFEAGDLLPGYVAIGLVLLYAGASAVAGARSVRAADV